MSAIAQFAVVLKHAPSAEAEPLKRAFQVFSNLTDADAIRMAASSCGILMKRLGRDAARGLQMALQDEGIATAVVADEELPHLPEPRTIQRVELKDDHLQMLDALGRPLSTPWEEITLVAAGEVQQYEVSAKRTDVRVMGLSPLRKTDIRHKVKTDAHWVLELICNRREARFAIDARRFLFKGLIDEPNFELKDKFIWLVREVCVRATHATLSRGALRLHEGHNDVLKYVNRQMLTDEIVWLMWHLAKAKR